jgi:hypothetical protein
MFTYIFLSEFWKKGIFFRLNANGVDLNSDFPEFFKRRSKKSQPETEAIKEWSSKFQFVLSGHLRSGNLELSSRKSAESSFPFYNRKNSLLTFTQGDVTPDEDVFKHLVSTFDENQLNFSENCVVSKNYFKKRKSDLCQFCCLNFNRQIFGTRLRNSLACLCILT